MRGFPPLHLLVLTVIFLIIGVPLYRLTSHGPAQAAPVIEEMTESSKIKTYLRLKYAHQPMSLSAMSGGVDLLKGVDFSNATADPETTIEIPHGGIEIVLNAKWPEGTPNTALTLELEPEGLDSKSETRWTSGTPELNEVLIFNWP